MVDKRKLSMRIMIRSWEKKLYILLFAITINPSILMQLQKNWVYQKKLLKKKLKNFIWQILSGEQNPDIMRLTIFV
jgi:hypothetical protein